MSDALDYEPKTNPETGRELLPNPERGCGYLKEEKGYIRTDPVRDPDGDIPTFVTFDQPVPYKEGTLRSYQQFDGLAFQRSLDDDFQTIPEDDVSNLWERLEGSEDGDHWGEITTAFAQDMLMWVGETYYEDPAEYVEECRKYGLSKAIPVSKRQGPPAINPFHTRVFLVHPTAYRVYEQTTETESDGETVESTEKVRVSYLDDDRLGDDDADDPVKTVPGVIGYSYLTRVVWTAPEDGDIPKWAQQYEDTGQLEIVDMGDPVPEDEVSERLPTVDDVAADEAQDNRELAQQVADELAEPATRSSPGHGGTLDAGDDEDTADDQSGADDPEADSDASGASNDKLDIVVPSDKDGRDVESATPIEHVLPDKWVDAVDADTVDELTADDLPNGYNERKAIAADVGADVSPQPGGDELDQAILDAVNAAK